MNQGKLDMVKQEMARLNSHILRIIVFFEAENGEVLHNKNKKDLKTTVAEIISP